MERALAELVVTGIVHTGPFHRTLLADEAFRRGDVHTGLVADILKRQESAGQPEPATARE
jgi:biotin carboxylase